MSEILNAQSISKAFSDGNKTLQILTDVNLVVEKGEQIAILGRSGSGKSTLLHVLGGLMSLDSGSVHIEGKNMSDASPSARARIRNESLGFVYQFHHLLPEFSALENVAMPLWLRGGREAKHAREKAQRLLRIMHLGSRTKHYPHQLSGGEKQRVAVARALATEPALVLGDELTGNLDVDNAESVLELISEMRSQFSTAFVIVTHDHSVANRMDRVLWLENSTLCHDAR